MIILLSLIHTHIISNLSFFSFVKTKILGRMFMLLFSRGCQDVKKCILAVLQCKYFFVFILTSNTIHSTVFYSKLNLMLNNLTFFAVYGKVTYSYSYSKLFLQNGELDFQCILNSVLACSSKKMLSYCPKKTLKWLL